MNKPECPKNKYVGLHEVHMNELQNAKPSVRVSHHPCMWCGTVITVNWVNLAGEHR